MVDISVFFFNALSPQNNNDDFDSNLQDRTIERGSTEMRRIVETFHRFPKSATREEESIVGTPQEGTSSFSAENEFK